MRGLVSVYMHVCVPTFVGLCVYVHVCMYVCGWVCLCEYLCAFVCVPLCVCKSACVFAKMRKFVWMCFRAYVFFVCMFVGVRVCT